MAEEKTPQAEVEERETESEREEAEEEEEAYEDIVTVGGGAILFPALVLAHYRYFLLHARYGEPGGVPYRYAPDGGAGRSRSLRARERARATYVRALESFEGSEGRIQGAYWCVFAPSAVALTVKPGPRVLGFLWRREPVMRLHRATDWLTTAYSDITVLLHHCDTMAFKAAEVLRGSAKEIALEWVFSAERFLLAAAEERARRIGGGARRRGRAARGEAGERGTPLKRPIRPAGAPPGGGAPPPFNVIAHARDELLEIEKYYDRAAGKAARIVYFWGMVVGVIVSFLLLSLLAFIVHRTFFAFELDETATQNFFVAYAAGAFGAVVSVLIRMRREDGFTLDYEVGRKVSFRLGSYRPFIGAVFGLVIYFAIESELLQIAVPDRDPATGASAASFYFLALLAFVAGFSERLTHVVLGSAERSIAATIEGRDLGRQEADDEDDDADRPSRLASPQGSGPTDQPA